MRLLVGEEPTFHLGAVVTGKQAVFYLGWVGVILIWKECDCPTCKEVRSAGGS